MAFSMYREYLLEYDFSNKKKLFWALVGAPYDRFVTMSVDEYLEFRAATLPREHVLLEFECGRLGLRWVIKYFKAWLKFKFKKSYE